LKNSVNAEPPLIEANLSLQKFLPASSTMMVWEGVVIGQQVNLAVRIIFNGSLQFDHTYFPGRPIIHKVKGSLKIQGLRPILTVNPDR
jgi:hypothetical protein